ncbi:MAG: bifunctional 2-polyprenyl-6-hydroxyphenol methylase/3-demethylubiquinol 3-O-methyltransferase UbiG, partial [Mariprofundaceae bacterium]
VADTVAACANLLKPGGRFFFATLNRTPKSYLSAIIGAEYLLGWLPKGTHRYHKFIRPSELTAAVRAAGLTPENLCGLSYQLLQDQFKLSSDLSVNYMGMACKVV